MSGLIAIGLPSRLIPAAHLPRWHVLYCGDYLWAMLIFFGLALCWKGAGTFKVVVTTLLLTYFIEFTQLFHPPWLEQLRSIKICALVIGYDYSWSDLVAYTLGISTGCLIEWAMLRRKLSTRIHLAQ